MYGIYTSYREVSMGTKKVIIIGAGPGGRLHHVRAPRAARVEPGVARRLAAPKDKRRAVGFALAVAGAGEDRLDARTIVAAGRLGPAERAPRRRQDGGTHLGGRGGPGEQQ